MKRLHRSRSNKLLGGVLDGLSEMLHVDATILRVIFMILTVFTAFFPLIIIYFASYFIIPEESL